MDTEERVINDVESVLHQAGYTLADYFRATAKRNSTLLMMDDANIAECIALYDAINAGGLARGEKGKKLEDLSSILFEKGIDNLFDVYRNCRTSTNEIDLLVRWTEMARLSGISNSFPCFGELFLCECKNYDGPVNVTYVGKFSSLMSVTNTGLGVMISWDGVTGRSNWSDSKGLIKKIALHENRFIIVLDKADLRKICDKKENVLSLVYDKYVALKNEIDYDKYISKHDAEDTLNGEG